MKIYTIEDLKEGRVILKNDGSKKQLREVLEKAFPKGGIIDSSFKYFSNNPDSEMFFRRMNQLPIPVQSVRYFIEGWDQPMYKNLTLELTTAHYIAASDLVTDLNSQFIAEYKRAAGSGDHIDFNIGEILIDVSMESNNSGMVRKYKISGYEIRRGKYIDLTLSQRTIINTSKRLLHKAFNSIGCCRRDDILFDVEAKMEY